MVIKGDNMSAERHKVYNEEPVYYCSRCLSLKVKSVLGVSGLDYCDECGSTDIEQTDIFDWENQYKDKYGFKYLDNNF